uniref:Uncharacterized protein n=1 Tax=Phyllostachys edulis TaxID=38705 RepID=D3IVN8_PHYED|nr:hypothetical protein [Phyllostachys edulis]
MAEKRQRKPRAPHTPCDAKAERNRYGTAEAAERGLRGKLRLALGQIWVTKALPAAAAAAAAATKGDEMPFKSILVQMTRCQYKRCRAVRLFSRKLQAFA